MTFPCSEQRRCVGTGLLDDATWGTVLDRETRYGLDNSLICVFLCLCACARENLDQYRPELCPCQAGIHHLVWTMRTDGESRLGKQLRPFHFGPGGMDHCRRQDGPPATGHKAHSYPGPAAWGFKVRPGCEPAKKERKKTENCGVCRISRVPTNRAMSITSRLTRLGAV